MSRRVDVTTAEKISVALLTRAAFGIGTALNYAELSGLSKPLICAVLARPLSDVRTYTALLTGQNDRRGHAR
ncbi:hypothetical protein LJR289_005758 [Pseudoduganella sp. LjRoot289]|uniref:hypothetical protein n=1 Tax=Pseudoduganella sp. LjRoot289 TaxID=3342314 RepID=UPI003ECF8288